MEQKQFNFDVSRGGVQHRLPVRQGDTKSRTVMAKFFSGDTQIEFSSAYIRALRPSGAQLYAPCEVQDNEALYTLTSEDLSEGGVFECEFELHNGEQIMTSPKFLVDCTALLYDGEGVKSSDSYKAYQAALLKLENMKVSAVSGDQTGVEVSTTDTEISMVFTVRDGKDGVIIDSVTYKGRNAADTANVYTVKVVKSDGTLFKTFDIEANDGKKGDKGDAPVKGVDYWTAAEVAEIQNAKEAANTAADAANAAATSAKEDVKNALSVVDTVIKEAKSATNGARYAEADAVATANTIKKAAEAGDFNGKDGTTPVRGVDYWTDEDKDEIGVERGTGSGSVQMRNTNSITAPAGGSTVHPEPESTTDAPNATGVGAFAIGGGTVASGDASSAEGVLSTASATASHAEGAGVAATGDASHAEGFYTEAGGAYSHAEGYGTVAAGAASHAGGFINKTSAPYSTVIGKYGEILGADDTRLFVVGNGTAEEKRSNAFEVDADGTGKLGNKHIMTEDDISVVTFDYDNTTVGSPDTPCNVYINKNPATAAETLEFLRYNPKVVIRCKMQTGEAGYQTDVVIGAESFNCSVDSMFGDSDMTADFGTFTITYDNEGVSGAGFYYAPKTVIKNGAGAGSLLMDNNNTVTEPDDANTGIPVHSKGTPQANGIGSFAIGAGTKAEGHASTAEGINTTAGYVRDDEIKSRNVGSHAEGINTFAKSSGSHAEGFYTESLASNSHTEGFQTKVNSKGWSGHAEGRETIVNEKAGHAEGYLTQTNGTEAHAEGMSTKAEGDRAHAEGENTIAGVKVGDTFNGTTVTDTNRTNYRAAHAEGIETKAYIKGSHAEGIKTVASGEGAHAEGTISTDKTGNTASGKGSHAEGGDTTASGNFGHAEGDRAKATGSAAHAEGVLTTAGYRSHAEGEKTVAGGNDGDSNSRAAHAEGLRTTATGTGSHSEGKETKAIAEAAHAEGAGTTASGVASHAGGTSTVASWESSTVVGKYNKTTDLSHTGSNPLFVVGNGTSASVRSNALEVYADGTGVLNGGEILTENTYYVDWGTLTGSAETTVMTTTDVTVKDKNNSAVTLAQFYTTLHDLIGSNKNNLQIVLRGSLPIADTFNVKCVATSVSEAGNTIQISAVAGYYHSSDARATTNLSIKLNITFTTEIDTAAELIVFTYNETPAMPCLIEGTKITMSDNTTKPVEQVKAGDVVLSYNPVTKEKTNAVVLACYLTGRSNKFDVYSFENGKHLTAYGIHGFYANELGYVKNIQDISKTNELISEDLDTTYLIVKRQMFFHGTPKARYNLIVSNNLYFANGILLGHSPWQKGQYYINRNGMNALPETLKTAFQTEIDKYNAYQSFMNNPAYHSEVAESYKTLSNAINEIKIYKDKLSKSDYKVQKYTEGVLSEEEWEEAKAKRAAWRQAVNDNEQLRDESKVLVDTIIAKYRNGVTAKSLFDECCTMDNAMLETVKACFVSSNSTEQSTD